jgi:hypothetical protein
LKTAILTLGLTCFSVAGPLQRTALADADETASAPSDASAMSTASSSSAEDSSASPAADTAMASGSKVICQDDDSKPKIKVSGVMDFYYMYQFSDPTQNTHITGRIYDYQHNAPTLALAWLDVVQPTPKAGGLGWTMSLATGDSVDADHADAASRKGEARWKNFQQIYATYAWADGSTLDFGKYLSPYGYDTTKVILNYNYSLTLATFLAPNYVGGLRYTHPWSISKGSFLSAYVINSVYHTNTSGINEDNGRPDFILRAGYNTPDGKFSYIPAVGFGKDRLGSPATGAKDDSKVLLWDNWLTYKASDKSTIAGEYIYQKLDGDTYNTRGDGYGVYYRYQIDPKKAVAFRFSGLHKKTTIPATSITKFTATEFTGTYEIKLTPSLTTRLEYRHDHSNNAAAFGFVDGDSPIPTSSQDTGTVAFLYTF